VYFVDTSALVKAYISEPPGTGTVLTAFQALGGSSLYVSSLVAAETLAVLARERRKGNLTTSAFQRLRADLANHVVTTLNVVEIREPLLQRAIGLIDAHRDRSVGPVDMVHLATAEHLKRAFPDRKLGFMCSDAGLKTAVSAHGIEVFDPAVDPTHALLPAD
jgi:predicted nucleic acid-binding protein